MVYKAVLKAYKTLGLVGGAIILLVIYQLWTSSIYGNMVQMDEATVQEGLVESNTEIFIRQVKERMSERSRELFERSHNEDYRPKFGDRLKTLGNTAELSKHGIPSVKALEMNININQSTSSKITEDQKKTPEYDTQIHGEPVLTPFTDSHLESAFINNSNKQKTITAKHNATGLWEKKLVLGNKALSSLDPKSLFFNMQIEHEEELAIKGGPYEGLPYYKSTCWPSKLPGKDEVWKMYHTNPYAINRCVNGGMGQDHCTRDFGQMIRYVYLDRIEGSNSYNRTTDNSSPKPTLSSVLKERLRDRGYSERKIAEMSRTMNRRWYEVPNHWPRPKVTYEEPWRMRCLPYVYLAGVTKSGTTDLYDKLILHPDIAEPSMKEPMYFDRNRIGLDRIGTAATEMVNGRPRRSRPSILKYGQQQSTREKRGTTEQYLRKRGTYASLSHYLDLFDHAGHKIESSVNETDYHNKITLDGTPCYLWDYDGWKDIPGNKGLDEPKYTLANTLAAINPKAKIILILREPSERLLSHYRKTRSEENYPISEFHRVVTKAIHLFDECRRKRSARSCAYDITATNELQNHVFLRASLYSIFIKDFLEVFPMEQLLVIRGEDYYNDRETTLKKVFSFLGLEDPPPTMLNVNEKNIRNKHSGYRPMLIETRELLQGFFRPFNIELAELFNNNLFHWGY